ncbi:MAG: hypothetical protein AAF682_28390 [Planctomycetota bacterium]
MTHRTPLLLLAPLLATVGLLAAGASTPPASAPALLLETDAEGEVLSGSVEALREAVERGEPIRVGWALEFRMPGQDEPERLTHWCDAGFVTVWKGQVFAQIRDIYTQGPVFDRAAIHLGREPHGWVAMLGSNGTLQSVFAGGEPSTQTVATRWATGAAR